jgi:hypothetical protein
MTRLTQDRRRALALCFAAAMLSAHLSAQAAAGSPWIPTPSWKRPQDPNKAETVLGRASGRRRLAAATAPYFAGFDVVTTKQEDLVK